MDRFLALFALSLLVVCSDCFEVRPRKLAATSASSHGSVKRDDETYSSNVQSADTRSRVNVHAGSRVNVQVRTIMDLLEERYDLPFLYNRSLDGTTQDTSTDHEMIADWSKMRRFLYRATTDNKNPLTVTQVLNLMNFLNQTFPDNLLLQRSILMQSPRIVTKNVATRLSPTVEFLQSLYGPTLFVHAVTRNPDLLLTTGTGYRGDTLDLVDVFLRQDLQLSANSVRQLKKSSPGLFQLSMVQLLSVVSYLRNLLDVPSPSSTLASHDTSSSKATATIAKLIRTHPNIFQLSVADNLQPRIQYFQTRLGLSVSELAGWIKSSSGAVLGLSVARNLGPTLDLLSTLLPNSNDLRKALASHAQILGLSLPNLRSKIDYLNQLDASSTRTPSIPGSSLASRVLLRSPTVYSLSLQDNIVPTVEFLARIWGTTASSQPAGNTTKQSSVDISTLLCEYPSILTLSLEGNIQPTVNFYVRAGYLSLDGDGRLEATNGRGMIVRGRYIAASLHTRLLPRWTYYCKQTQQGHRPSDLDSGEPLPVPPLHVLAGTTDDIFCEKCGFDFIHYDLFKQKAIPRLKFRSQFDTWLQTGRPIDM